MTALMAWLEDAVFKNRPAILLLFAVITAFLGYQAAQLRVDAGFEKLLPLEHPYMQTFIKHKDEFGGANRLLVAVRAKQGDIFTPDFFKTLKAVTDEVFFLPGVDRASVRSIFTPNERFIEIVEGGFSGGNIVPADFRPTPEALAQVRENLLKANIVGRLVANDFTAAIVSAQLVEIDPTTRQRLNYLQVARQLEEKIRAPFLGPNTDIHIVGFAKVVGDIADGAAGVILFFGIATLVTGVLVYWYTRSVWLTVLPLGCALLTTVWQLGLLTLLGYGIDPLSILVPFLLFAIAVSHSIQVVNTFKLGAAGGLDSEAAARAAFRKLLGPGTIALLTNAFAFATLGLIAINIIREIAITASMGVILILLTKLVLLSVLLSYVKFDAAFLKRDLQRIESREPVWRFLALAARPRPALAIIAVCAAMFAYSWHRSGAVKIGDFHAGVPELRQEARYNRDTEIITTRFSIGVDILTAIVETIPDGCIQHDIVDRIDRFQWYIANLPGVNSTMSLPQVAKVISAGFNEGNPKWRVLPRNSQLLVQAVSPIESSSGLLNRNCSVMPVYIFTTDHKAETIERLTAAIEAYAAEHNSDRHTIRLATGNVGVMAATNQAVKAAQFPMLMWVYVSIIALTYAGFRSWRATVCVISPLALVSLLAYALMAELEIGLKVATLPVETLGVGVGVDYGIYIFSRFLAAKREGKSFEESYLIAIRQTGSAVLVTGVCLSIGVSTWAFSALKFQADMGILLTFMLLVNMLGALLLSPAIAAWLWRLTARWEKRPA
mgnify:CR=1 FL=1